MENEQALASQWEVLQARRNQVADTVARLQGRLMNLALEPQVAQLIFRKNEQKRRANELGAKIAALKKEIKDREKSIASHRIALTNPALPVSVTVGEAGMTVGVPNNVGQPILDCRARNKQTELLIGQVTTMLQEAESEIAAVEAGYRRFKNGAKLELEIIEREKQECRDRELAFAAQSEEHLAWIFRHAPFYKDGALKLYRSKFPQADISQFLPVKPVIVSPPSKTKEKTRGIVFSERNSSNHGRGVLAVWTFAVVMNQTHNGQLLPQHRDDAVRFLREFLTREDYNNLDVPLAYEKLLGVTRLCLQQRQQMNKVTVGEPVGWKILKVGKKHRLFLSIDEANNRIVFLPCPRKNSYQSH